MSCFVLSKCPRVSTHSSMLPSKDEILSKKKKACIYCVYSKSLKANKVLKCNPAPQSGLKHFI